MRTSEELTNEMAELLLKISSMLMTSGANTSRILLIINKFSSLMQVDAEIFINHKAFIITLSDHHQQNKTTLVKRLPEHRINFSLISGLSRIAHQAEVEHWKMPQLKEEVKQLDRQNKHKLWFVVLAVALADGALARIFGGSYACFAVVALATALGLLVRTLMSKKQFNVYLSTFAGSLVAALSAAMMMGYMHSGELPIALATSVLFSVPGVPMVNSFTDFIDGYFITGLVRFMHAVLFVFAIAAALFIVTYLFKIPVL